MGPDSDKAGTGPLILHASAVAIDGRALLIRGASGSGKSGLALEMMALGARLVADDRVILTPTAQGIVLSAPDLVRGLIEARGLGLLRAEAVAQAMLIGIVDLDIPETERLPPERHESLLGRTVPVLHKSAWGYFPAALMQYVKGGRSER